MQRIPLHTAGGDVEWFQAAAEGSPEGDDSIVNAEGAGLGLGIFVERMLLG